VIGFAGLAPCVHCGFCLQSCPTFLITGDEADSPRGRIVLMRALAAGDIPADDPSLLTHLDRCLGCRGCEPVCPSGVAYGGALEAARERIAATRPVPLSGRLVLEVMAHPPLRRPLLAITRLLRPAAGLLAGRGRLGFAALMVAASRPWRGPQPAATTPVGATAVGATHASPLPSAPSPGYLRSDATAAIFSGCVQSGLFGHVNAAAERTLAANGYRVVPVPGQGCCGALHAHAGLLAEARDLARANVAAFAGVPDAAVAVTAAGCGAMLCAYGDLLADDPLAPAARALAARVADVTQLLETAGPRPGGPLAVRVAYDPPCHLLHAQRVARAPRAVLEAVPGVEVVAHDEAELCCGSAGIYGLLQPRMSREVLARKVDALRAAAPDVVVTGNPGCAMQLGAGLGAAGSAIGVAHPVELLDRSYAAAGYYRE
jgi:glycolate oxidase iron-sulfur subunit